MAIKVGINGFGRIGRMVFRAVAKDFKYIEIVSDKTRDSYAALLARHNQRPEGFLMVGNSLRSDVLPVLALGVLTPSNFRHGCLRFQPVLQCLGRLLQGHDLLLLLFNLLSLLRHILGVLFFERFDLLGVAIEGLPDGREQLCLVSLGGLRGSRLSTAGRLRRLHTFSRRRMG